MAEIDAACYLGGFYRYFTVLLMVLSQVLISTAMQTKRNFNLPEEKELLWNKTVQDFSAAHMKLTMKHNGWKLSHAV